jgi:hypothetical protein
MIAPIDHSICNILFLWQTIRADKKLSRWKYRHRESLYDEKRARLNSIIADPVVTSGRLHCTAHIPRMQCSTLTMLLSDYAKRLRTTSNQWVVEVRQIGRTIDRAF